MIVEEAHEKLAWILVLAINDSAVDISFEKDDIWDKFENIIPVAWQWMVDTDNWSRRCSPTIVDSNWLSSATVWKMVLLPEGAS